MLVKPSRRLDFTQIPILDIGSLVSGQSEPELISSLRAACTDVGFFYVKNHQIPLSLVRALKDAAKEFFQAPMSEKMNIAIDSRIQGYLPLGYRSYEGEERAGTSNQEGFWVGYERAISKEMPLSGPNQWPKRYPALKDAMLRYFDCLEGLTEALLQGFSRALGLSPDYLSTYYKQPLSRLKVNHYPPQPDPVSDDDIGVVPHSDSGGFTILWQDEWGGLEIQNKNGEWVGAPPVEETFVINIGNIMQIWSNGEFSSTPHRVVNRSGQDRYSIPLFVNPSADTLIMPVVGESEPYDSFNYGHYQRDLWRRTFPIANVD